MNAIAALAESGVRFVPEILVAGGGQQPLDGLAATLMGYLRGQAASPAIPVPPITAPPDSGPADSSAAGSEPAMP